MLCRRDLYLWQALKISLCKLRLKRKEKEEESERKVQRLSRRWMWHELSLTANRMWKSVSLVKADQVDVNHDGEEEEALKNATWPQVTGETRRRQRKRARQEEKEKEDERRAARRGEKDKITPRLVCIPQMFPHHPVRHLTHMSQIESHLTHICHVSHLHQVSLFAHVIVRVDNISYFSWRWAHTHKLLHCCCCCCFRCCYSSSCFASFFNNSTVDTRTKEEEARVLDNVYLLPPLAHSLTHTLTLIIARMKWMKTKLGKPRSDSWTCKLFHLPVTREILGWIERSQRVKKKV